MYIVKDETFKMVCLMTDADGDNVTGASLTITVSKNGGSFAAADDTTVTEIGNGWYTIDLSTSETDTAGPLIVRATATGAVEWRDRFWVRESFPAEIVEFTATHPDVAITSAGIDELVTAMMTADLDSEMTTYLAGSGTGPNSAKTMLGLLHKLNGAVVGGADIKVYRFDGVTLLWTHSIVTDADVETITSQGAPS